jgi:hypothetical protein
MERTMTDLLSRPASTTPGKTEASQDAGPRPLGLGAAIAGLVASAGSLFTCMAVAVVGWFLADAGAHGQTTDALRVGADAWLLGHGSGLSVAGTPVHVVPLALTVFFAVVAWRAGRWAARTSAPPEDDRATLLAGVVLSGVYVVVAVLTCLLSADDIASANFGRAVLGALVVSVVGGLGLASATGQLRAWIDRVPGWVRATVHGGVTGFLSLLVASVVLVAVRLVMGLGDAATLLSGLHLSPGDYVMYAVATIAVAPNAVLFGSAYLLGPGFAVGTGTSVSPSLVSLGAVPAFPLLSALPDSGPTPSWVVGVVALPVIAGAVGAVRAQRAYGVTAWDSAALRGFGSGVGAALLATVAIAASGGAMGTGRMAQIGAPVGEVLVAAVVAMGLGGLAGGLVTTLLQRRHAPLDEDLDEAGEEDVVETADEPVDEVVEEDEDDRPDDVEDTIEVPLLPRGPE